MIGAAFKPQNARRVSAHPLQSKTRRTPVRPAALKRVRPLDGNRKGKSKMAEFGETCKPVPGAIVAHPAPLALSLVPRTDANTADFMAGLLRAASSGCANQAARQKLQHAMRNALDAAVILRRRSVGVAHVG